MKQLNKKLVALSMLVFLLIPLSGCSIGNNSSKGSNTSKQTEQDGKVKDDPSIVQDTKKTKELNKEKEIFNGKVYVKDNTAVATMIIKDNVSESEAKALADKYAKELKSSYKDKKVNVQAVQNGKNVVDITID